MTTFKPFEEILNLWKAIILALVDIVIVHIQMFLELFGFGSVVTQIASVVKQLITTVFDLFARIAGVFDSIYGRCPGQIPCPCLQ